MNKNYAVVTPARDEEKYIRYTLDSMVRQHLLPVKWVLVDDGSKDSTQRIIGEYQREHPWIAIVSSCGSDLPRQGGVRVVDLFNRGLKELAGVSYDFIVKLDADLSLPADYFEKLSDCLDKDKEVGICGGYCVNIIGGRVVRERVASYHVRGAFKAYRRECFEAIAGLPRHFNWDGLDEMKAMSLKWKVVVLPLEVVHHRPTGSETNAGIKPSYRAGMEYFLDGNDSFTALLRAGVVAVRSIPGLISGIVFLFGYVAAALQNRDKHVDKDLQSFIRDFQHRRVRNYISSKLKSLGP